MPASNPRFVSRLTRNTLALILAGGRVLGSSISPPGAPNRRSRSAASSVSWTSPCRTASLGIRRIGVLTQYKAHSLILHIQKGWGFLRGEFGEFVELWPAQQRVVETACTRHRRRRVPEPGHLRNASPDYVLVLAGDHVYKMDDGAMIAHHVETGADMTVGCLEVELARAQEFGVMSTDGDGRIRRFQEKPTIRDHPRPAGPYASPPWASMSSTGTSCSSKLIRDADTRDSTHDFGKDIIPSAIERYRVMGYIFRDRAAASRPIGAMSAPSMPSGSRIWS